MNDENERHFLFGIAIVFGIALAVVAYFCGIGDEDMKCLKVVSFILICGFAIFFCVFLGFLLFGKSKNTDTKTWCVYSSTDNVPDDTERLLFCSDIEKNLDLKKLRFIDFDSSKIATDITTFSKCTNVEEITFYQNPGKGFSKDAFKGCTSLKTVNLVGNYEDWKGFEITVPVDCEIKFLPTKNVVIPEKKWKNYLIKIININNDSEKKKSENNQEKNPSEEAKSSNDASSLEGDKSPESANE